MADQLWSWLLTIVGATCFFLAGGLGTRKVWWAWYIGLFAQVLWTAYALIDLEHRLGFLVGVALYGYVYVRNCVKWTREHLAEKRAASEHAALVGSLVAKIEEQRETPEGVEIRSRFVRRVDPRDLPPLRHDQCRFSWLSLAYGYVRCEHRGKGHERHEAEDPRTWVAVSYENSVEFGSWDR